MSARSAGLPARALPTDPELDLGMRHDRDVQAHDADREADRIPMEARRSARREIEEARAEDGEPIVETPEHAILAFENAPLLRALIIDDHLLEKA